MTWPGGAKKVREKIVPFTVENPNAGKSWVDPEAVGMKAAFPNAKVAVLQQGKDCETLNIKNYAGCADAYTSHRMSKQGGNTGKHEWLYVGEYGKQHYTSLLKYDISALPKEAKVKKAVLKVFFAGSPHKLKINAFQVLKPWGEGTGNQKNYRGGRARGNNNCRDGSSTNEGECSWTYSAKPEKWGKQGCRQPGVDRGETSAAQAYIHKDLKKVEMPNIEGQNWISFDITKLVKTWQADPAKNNGVVLDKPEGAYGYYLFFSGQHATEPDLKPRLVIAFE
jgi:hypothetical protein